MSIHRAASRYAKSILDLSIEKGQLEGVFSDFNNLSAMGKASRELNLALNNPVLTSDKKTQHFKSPFFQRSQPTDFDLF